MNEVARKIETPAAPPVADVDVETQRAVERFLYLQAECLDDRRWDTWLDLFTPDGHYWMPASEDQTEGEGQANIFWEDLDYMSVRIRRNNHPHAWSQSPPNRLSHIVSNVVIESVDPATGDVVVRSKFQCTEYLRYGQRHFAGKYRHHLKKTPDGYRIELQRVDLLNAEGPFEYVLQWWL
jgi:3-phenylpropionate/cinnamic acid dioxygenase small subunit